MPDDAIIWQSQITRLEPMSRASLVDWRWRQHALRHCLNALPSGKAFFVYRVNFQIGSLFVT
jgi:hypothetical protein